MSPRFPVPSGCLAAERNAKACQADAEEREGHGLRHRHLGDGLDLVADRVRIGRRIGDGDVEALRREVERGRRVAGPGKQIEFCRKAVSTPPPIPSMLMLSVPAVIRALRAAMAAASLSGTPSVERFT